LDRLVVVLIRSHDGRGREIVLVVELVVVVVGDA
jgi:hypothetical protein